MKRSLGFGLILFSMTLASSLGAQGDWGNLFRPRFKRRGPSLKTQTVLGFQEPVKGQGRDLRMGEYKLDLSYPIFQSDREDVSLSLRCGAMELESDMRLPDQGDRLSGLFWDLGVSLQYRRQLSNGWLGGGMISFGSASDDPFSSPEETVGQALLFLSIPHGTAPEIEGSVENSPPGIDRRNRWIGLVHYSSQRQFLPHVPLPGIAYQFSFGPFLRGLVGFPVLSLVSRPAEDLDLQFFALLPRRISTQVRYAVHEDWKLQVGFDWRSRSFLRAGREHGKDRLVYNEKRVLAGIRWEPRPEMTLEIGAGYAFDRFWYEGESYGDRGDDRLDLGDGPVIQFEFRVRF